MQTDIMKRLEGGGRVCWKVITYYGVETVLKDWDRVYILTITESLSFVESRFTTSKVEHFLLLPAVQKGTIPRLFRWNTCSFFIARYDPEARYSVPERSEERRVGKEC